MNPPSVTRKTLVLIAGITWSLVGAVLMVLATEWLIAGHKWVIPIMIIGIVGGIVVFRFGFSKLVGINLKRIYQQAPGKEKVCLFAFQNTRSYFIALFMMVMGYSLRHSSLPKNYLALVYLVIGLALFLSSLEYYKQLLP